MDSIWFSCLLKICTKMIFLTVPKVFSPGGKQTFKILIKKLSTLDHVHNTILMK